jgi:hypothetical protein
MLSSVEVMGPHRITLRFASPHDDSMGTEGASGAARARVDAASEAVHVVECLDGQTCSTQERDVVILGDRADHALGPEPRIGA